MKANPTALFSLFAAILFFSANAEAKRFPGQNSRDFIAEECRVSNAGVSVNETKRGERQPVPFSLQAQGYELPGPHVAIREKGAAEDQQHDSLRFQAQKDELLQFCQGHLKRFLDDKARRTGSTFQVQGKCELRCIRGSM